MGENRPPPPPPSQFDVLLLRSLVLVLQCVGLWLQVFCVCSFFGFFVSVGADFLQTSFTKKRLKKEWILLAAHRTWARAPEEFSGSSLRFRGEPQGWRRCRWSAPLSLRSSFYFLHTDISHPSLPPSLFLFCVSSPLLLVLSSPSMTSVERTSFPASSLSTRTRRRVSRKRAMWTVSTWTRRPAGSGQHRASRGRSCSGHSHPWPPLTTDWPTWH